MKSKELVVRVLKKAQNMLSQDKVTHTVEELEHPKQNEILFLKNDIIDAQTINDLKGDFCSGCGACVNVCPIGAISMKRDEEGYLSPCLNFEQCIHCQKCANVCPVIHTQKFNRPNPDCYAVMADDETRRVSSSGGAFTLLANHILEQGGYVCGAAFDENFTVKHLIINETKDLDKLRGSKYVQSDTGKVFTKIKELLISGQKVLFSGCPCQVAGLNNFLGKRYDNLLTVDLVCHGGPSQGIFDRYIADTYGKENLKDFKFRTKKYGYNSFHQIAYLKNGEKIAGNIAFDPYEKCMHSGLAAKSICIDCPFASTPRQGDISIGDFWGISGYNPTYNDGLGTSVLLINNESGKIVWNSIKNRCKLSEPVPYDVVRRNNRFGSHINVPNGRHWFFNMLRNKTFSQAVDYALNRKFDVGIVGLWYGLNYGSMATYYALHHTLKEMGLSVLMVENSLRPDTEDIYSKTHPRRIATKFYDISKRYSLQDLRTLNNHCDTFLVGADQLWNVNLSRPYRQTYFLGFVEENKKKISVGTSFGWEYHGTEEEKLISSHNLKRFDHVSVRDSLSQRICAEWGIEAAEICDPALFCVKEDYEPIVKLAKLEKKDSFILAYILDPNEEIGKFLHEMANELKCKVIVILDLYPPLWEKRKKALKAEQYDNVEIASDVDLSEWLWYYKNSISVITDSFHGTIFSIIYEKPFITLSNPMRGAQRFISLLTPLALNSRLFNSVQEIVGPKELLNSLDYQIPNKLLYEVRTHALEWLREALYSPKKIHSNAIYEVYGDQKS